MRLSTLVGARLAADRDPELGGMTLDSRTVQPGDVFCALAGADSDGHDYVDQAVAAGACAVLAERDVMTAAAGAECPVIVMGDLRQKLSGIAGRFYGHPGRSVRCAGVTGTNGKTSITHHIAQLFGALGVDAAVGGTLGWGRPGLLAHAGAALTTVDAVTMQRQLAGLRDQGVAWAALEVSSHALDQHRVDGIEFDTAVFCNLSRDHLDYHGSMDHYEQAKRSLFRLPGIQTIVVNRDDPVGGAIAAEFAGRRRVLTYGAQSGADITWSDLVPADGGGLLGRWKTPWGDAELSLNLVGDYAAGNVAAAIGVVVGAGHDPAATLTACAGLTPVPGRMEFVSAPGAPLVVVDFAHTPDALAKALAALEVYVRGRLICVVGCGGERDKGKRPQMARIAESRADTVWLTSDNPRSETPRCIINDMIAGLADPAGARFEVDRAAAIHAAIGDAGPGDVVLIAGKGHEDYQEIAGVKHPFSDRDVASTALDAHAGGA